MTFRTDDPALAAAYDRKRHLPIVRELKPVSSVCDHCWGRSGCLLRVITGGRPLTCCVYDYFQQHSTSTVEAMVQYTCESSCVARQSWGHDKIPHDKDYCEYHCPVSQFLLDQPPSDYKIEPT